MTQKGQVLLCYKKRGFGAGKWNGPGGKVKQGESARDCAIRETKEETGIIPRNIVEAGYIDFVHPQGMEEKNTRCYIFTVLEFSGTLHETAECKPQWFSLQEIPYNQMWDDDKYWYPEMLLGVNIKKCIYFDKHELVVRVQEL